MGDNKPCEGLSGDAAIQCLLNSVLKDNASNEEDERAENSEKMWSCVVDEYKKSGGTEKQLLKKANIGFTAEPTGYKRFINDPASLELQEKFEFAYNDPKYYHCLADNNFPVPFAMNDFDGENLRDDQRRYEVNTAVDGIKKRLAGEEDDFTPNSDAYRRELAKRIYDWASETLHFYGDCKVECADYEAVDSNNGACTESSAVIYYAYKYAGLNPKFYFLHDLKPSLEWIELLPKLGTAMDHVFVGIPLKGKGVIHVDLIRWQFDAKYGFAVELSPRHFVSEAWLSNKRNNLDALLRYEESEKIDNLILKIAPESIASYISLLALYKVRDREGDLNDMLKLLGDRFRDHPFVVFNAVNIEPDKVRKEIDFDKKSPYLAAQVYYSIARASLPQFLTDFSGIKEARSKGVVLPQGAVDKLEKIKGVIIGLYEKSLLLDPNYLFAYRDLDQLFDDTGSYEDAVTFYRGAVKKYPDHAPFLFGAIKHLMALAGKLKSKPEDQQELVTEAKALSDKLIELEPNHPAAYFQRGLLHFSLNEHLPAIDAVGKSNGLYKLQGKKAPKELYQILLYSSIFSSNIEGALKAVDDALADYGGEGAAFLSKALVETFTWVMKMDTSDFTIADDIIKIPDEARKMFVGLISSIDLVCDRLSQYPSAGENVEAVRGYSLPFVALFLGKDDIRHWLDKISVKSSKKVVDKINQGLFQIGNLLLKTRSGFDHEVCSNLELLLDELDPFISDDSRPFFAAKIGVINGYILLEDRESASRLLKSTLVAHNPDPLLFSGIIADLHHNNNGSEKNIRRLFMALDLMWEERSFFAPEVRKKLGWYYEQLVPLCGEYGLDKAAEAARERAVELKKTSQ